MLVIMLFGCAKNWPSEIYINYKDLNGNVVRLSDFKGKRILLNFWDTWCTPCIEEMPSLEKAQDLLQLENYVFLFATTDQVAKINRFTKQHPFSFQYVQYQKSLDKLNIHALPVTFIYNTEGEMVKRIDGAADWESKEMITQLKAV